MITVLANYIMIRKGAQFRRALAATSPTLLYVVYRNEEFSGV